MKSRHFGSAFVCISFLFGFCSLFGLLFSGVDDSCASYGPMESSLLPWVEKYRPRQLSDMARLESGSTYQESRIVQQCRSFLASRQGLPHLLLCGSSGTGKTSLVQSLVHELYPEAIDRVECVREFNASKDRGIDVVRTDIQTFVTRAPSRRSPYRLLILDEADHLTNVAQDALRLIMEEHTTTTRFVLIANNRRGILPALQSRTTFLWFPLLPENVIVSRLRWIVEKEHLRMAPRPNHGLLLATGKNSDQAIKTETNKTATNKTETNKTGTNKTGTEEKETKGENKEKNSKRSSPASVPKRKDEQDDPHFWSRLAEEAGGDLRRAVDLLQAVAREADGEPLAFLHLEIVTQNNERQVACAQLLHKAAASGSAERMREGADHFLADGWSLAEFASFLHKMLIDTVRPSALQDHQKAGIFIAVAAAESHLLEGADERLELYSLQTSIWEFLQKDVLPPE